MNDGIKKRRAVIIGRYQMFHKGHLNIMKYIDSQPDIDEIIVGIGSSQYDRNNKNWEMPWITNPFTFEERSDMVDSAMRGEVKKPYSIIPIQDQHNCKLWVEYVIEKLPEFNVFFTNTKTESEPFNRRGYEVRGIPIRDSFHAQAIREMIALGENWREFVPPGVVNFMERAGGEKIMRELFQEHSEEMIEAHNYFPDWEWRTFDKLTPADREKLQGLETASKKSYKDTYLLFPQRPDLNMKIRGDVLKVKKTIKEELDLGLEESATYSYRSPIKKKALEVMLNDIRMPLPEGSVKLSDYVSLEEVTGALKAANIPFIPFEVEKEREVKVYNGCAIDLQKIRFSVSPISSSSYASKTGMSIETVAIETRSKKKIMETVKELGLDKYRPQHYTRFLLDEIRDYKAKGLSWSGDKAGK